MTMLRLALCFVAFFVGDSVCSSFAAPEGLYNDVLLREMVARMGNDLIDQERDYIDLPAQRMSLPLSDGISSRGGLNDLPAALDYDDLALSPSLRDREYLSHSSLIGTMIGPYAGNNKNLQRLKPTATGGKSTAEMKTEGVLPSYCNPPNPCPIGYTADDGCLEDFENTAGFSRDYQSMQECMCDSEHMFQCSDSSMDSEITALARSIQNEGVLDSTLDDIMSHLNLPGGQHFVAKKILPSNQNYNPYLQGEKLKIAAKKGHTGKQREMGHSYLQD